MPYNEKIPVALQELLIWLYELSLETSPIKLSFGYIQDHYCHKGLVLREAPPIVVEKLVNDSRIARVGLTEYGLIVYPNETWQPKHSENN